MYCIIVKYFHKFLFLLNLIVPALQTQQISFEFPCEPLPDLQWSGARSGWRLLPGLQPSQCPHDPLLCHHDVLLQGNHQISLADPGFLASALSLF